MLLQQPPHHRNDLRRRRARYQVFRDQHLRPQPQSDTCGLTAGVDQ
jgi:hypothetical protein